MFSVLSADCMMIGLSMHGRGGSCNLFKHCKETLILLLGIFILLTLEELHKPHIATNGNADYAKLLLLQSKGRSLYCLIWMCIVQIYAFDRSFEGAIAACGAPLVGILAERLFGFTVCPSCALYQASPSLEHTGVLRVCRTDALMHSVVSLLLAMQEPRALVSVYSPLRTGILLFGCGYLLGHATTIVCTEMLWRSMAAQDCVKLPLEDVCENAEGALALGNALLVRMAEGA